MCLTLKCLVVVVLSLLSTSLQSTTAFAFAASRTKNNHIRHLPNLSASPSDDDNGGGNKDKDEQLASNVRRALLASSLAALTYNGAILAPALGILPPGYEKVSPLQFIAALGDPGASSGEGAERWGLWPTDPGPRGLRLRDYERIKTSGDDGRSMVEETAPSWLNDDDFFLDENAIIMPQPEFPLGEGNYLVTGGRTVTTGLTVDASGKWTLNSGKLYDVTHLPCRAARYRPLNLNGGLRGSPATVRRGDFPVAPGGIMPEVPGTTKQDYAVIFVVGKQKMI
eukprot:CAMPEP_0172307908 /NCGR_PEP_ID=MMETSP1058-20130122/8665_1 /TAXON_ID=83371 /ORGANISM="Detonula confervacea, Strain CCMP 353" /LENGTH=281 /DNA_ID=CAMNT_0013020215 /DNA_START=45 /DNA_END=890 /DNA_ORIENTATION=+